MACLIGREARVALVRADGSGAGAAERDALHRRVGFFFARRIATPAVIDVARDVNAGPTAFDLVAGAALRCPSTAIVLATRACSARILGSSRTAGLVGGARRGEHSTPDEEAKAKKSHLSFSAKSAQQRNPIQTLAEAHTLSEPSHPSHMPRATH